MQRLILLAFALIISCLVYPHSTAQTPLGHANPDGNGKESTVRYRYLFENDRFTTPLQEVEFDGQGRGQFRFKRKDGGEIINKLEVSPTVLSQIQILFDAMNFLASNEEYQHKKDFSHLGKMTITLASNGKERTVSFNYTDNQTMSGLTQIFRNIATQETRVFELDAVRNSDPISTPSQLRYLDNELRSKSIADPQRFVPILKDIQLDESIPLIARNHAERLLQMIRKGK
ncbi:MAG: hypothetical protein L0220_26740 [Acidobacteria bacterium]|nr:hypothetical protein [Acidobacteriota bacterium]